MAVGPGHAQRGDEMRAAVARRLCARAAGRRSSSMARGEILVGSRPARRMDAGRAVERFDHKPGIVGESRQLRGVCRGLRLDAGIGAEARAGFFRLGAGRARPRKPLRCRKATSSSRNLVELARVVRRDHDPAGDAAMGRLAHVTAIFCRSTSLPMPLRASASKARNCSSENGIFSAVPWISTILPPPVMTKFASVSASESSA